MNETINPVLERANYASDTILAIRETCLGVTEAAGAFFQTSSEQYDTADAEVKKAIRLLNDASAVLVAFGESVLPDLIRAKAEADAKQAEEDAKSEASA